jgi:hypothetical protein
MVRSLRLAVRTSPSHGENRSSILLGSASGLHFQLILFSIFEQLSHQQGRWDSLRSSSIPSRKQTAWTQSESLSGTQPNRYDA